MNPQMKVRITAQNDSSPGFKGVISDANAASGAVVSAGQRASSALRTQSTALATVAKSSANAANQQRNLVFQLNDMAVSLAGGANPLMVFAQQGSQIATIYGPNEGGLGKALQETGNLAVGLVTKFWPIAAVVAAGTAAIGGMTAAINESSDTQVGFGDVAVATWQVFADGVYSLVQPAITAIGGWLGDMWNMAWPIIEMAGNSIIATFVGAFDASKAVWSAFPAVMGDFIISTANNVIGGVESMINGAIGLLNDFKGSLGISGDLGTVSFSGLDNPYEGAMSGVAEDVVKSFQGAFGVDYLGGLFDAISNKAVALAQAAETAGKAAAGAGNDMKPLNLGLEAANDNAEKLTDTMASGLTDGIMSVWKAFKSGENVLEAIGNQVLSLIDSLLSSTIQSFLGTLFGGFKLPGFGGNLSVAGMPTYAAGTDFHPGGMALVGERGPELVSLPRGSAVSTAGETAAMLGGGGQSRILVELSPQLIGQILEVARNQNLQLIKSNAPAAVMQAQRNRV